MSMCITMKKTRFGVYGQGQWGLGKFRLWVVGV